MKVTKILGFTEEEIVTLSQAGKILGALASALAESGEVASELDEVKLDDATTGLVNALKEVLTRI